MRLAKWLREVLSGTGRPGGVGSEAPDAAASALAGNEALAEVLAVVPESPVPFGRGEADDGLPLCQEHERMSSMIHPGVAALKHWDSGSTQQATVPASRIDRMPKPHITIGGVDGKMPIPKLWNRPAMNRL
jgi:hypothetical protein